MLKEIIQSKLSKAFNPIKLEVINESYMHNVPDGSESHFKVLIVSDIFAGNRLLQRHRRVNDVLSEELSNHIHALSIYTYTSDEWAEKQSLPESPKCRGGSNHN